MARALLDGGMDALADPRNRAPRRSPDRDRRGPAAVEYCLTAAMISVVIISALSAAASSIRSPLDTAAAAIEAPKL
jgi:Flp pilus assembly pilin Flp